MFAAIDNTVTLPGYTRADVAGFVMLRKGLRLQANVENLFDAKLFRERRQQHEHLARIPAHHPACSDHQLLIQRSVAGAAVVHRSFSEGGEPRPTTNRCELRD